MAGHRRPGEIQHAVQRLQTQPSGTRPCLQRGFASCLFPPSGLVLSPDEPVLCNPFASEPLFFSGVAFLLGRA